MAETYSEDFFSSIRIKEAEVHLARRAFAQTLEAQYEQIRTGQPMPNHLLWAARLTQSETGTTRQVERARRMQDLAVLAVASATEVSGPPTIPEVTNVLSLLEDPIQDSLDEPVSAREAIVGALHGGQLVLTLGSQLSLGEGVFDTTRPSHPQLA